jgi:hypothetical protein
MNMTYITPNPQMNAGSTFMPDVDRISTLRAEPADLSPSPAVIAHSEIADPILEAGFDGDDLGLFNDTIDSFSWNHLEAVLPATSKAAEKRLLSDISGEAHAGRSPLLTGFHRNSLVIGELVAIMGPSGSGKTMLLNRLAHRSMPPKAKLAGEIIINDVPANLGNIRSSSSYVEQQDHLIGSITTAETLGFAAKLGLNE